MADTMEFGDLAILLAVAVAAPLLARLARRLSISSVVLEVAMGVIIGPELLDWVDADGLVNEFGTFGLALLFFLAGFEINVSRLRGDPLRSASMAWAGSLIIGIAIGGFLALEGVVIDSLLVGLILTTTALGALLPILRDRGELSTPFGQFVMANGALGEFGPIVAMAILFAGDSPLVGSLVLLGFVVLVAAVLALTRVAGPRRYETAMRAGLHSSSQLPVRICLLLVAVLVWIAAEVGLDVLLGAFAAGVVIRYAVGGDRAAVDPDVELFSEKLEGIGFGVFIPIFFVSTGVQFDLDALFSSASTALKVPIFAALILLARALPVWLAHRRVLDVRSRWSLAFYSATALPLIVALTHLGVETDRMRPENATALVAAGMLSVLVFPVVASSIRRPGVEEPLVV